jgi:hypothetical protein
MGMVVLTVAGVANSSIHAAASWFAVQVETGGSGLARDRIKIGRDDAGVNGVLPRLYGLGFVRGVAEWMLLFGNLAEAGFV